MASKSIQLGIGLIGIGRPWGHTNAIVPEKSEALQLLRNAYKFGIRYFDTAPSYGESEERLGEFLITLTKQQREEVIVATKFGEHWNKEKQEAYVDQSFPALQNSLRKSISYLKKIDILYLHKVTLDALQSKDVIKGFEYAKQLGISRFGASVSDVEAAKYVCNDPLFSVIQFPYNLSNNKFSEIIDLANEKNKMIVINRPFNMGDLLYSEEYKRMDPNEFKKQAYHHILEKDFTGFILTGTKSQEHLLENYKIFSQLNQNAPI